MATCKDCIHSGICEVQLEPHYLLDRVQKLMRESNNVEHKCPSFQDRSRFVELPCRVSGDCFFINQNGTIQRATLERVYMFSTSTELFLNVGREIYNASLNELHIGLFPTYEEAEQAKERERK